MELDNEYEYLMKKLGIKGLEVNEFKKAFNVTPLKDIRSYNNQKYASMGNSALHLLLSELLFDGKDDSRAYKDDLFEYESYDNWINAYNTFDLKKYVYSNDGNVYDGFVVQSSLFEAIAGIIFINQGYNALKNWYEDFISINQEQLIKNNIKIINSFSY